MGNYIHIDLDELNNAISALDRYIIARSALVTQLLSEVEQTHRAWRAEDSEAFLVKWHAMSSSDGVFTVTKENLKNYRDLLKSVYNIYKKAQSESVEQASKISG